MLSIASTQCYLCASFYNTSIFAGAWIARASGRVAFHWKERHCLIKDFFVSYNAHVDVLLIERLRSRNLCMVRGVHRIQVEYFREREDERGSEGRLGRAGTNKMRNWWKVKRETYLATLPTRAASRIKGWLRLRQCLPEEESIQKQVPVATQQYTQVWWHPLCGRVDLLLKDMGVILSAPWKEKAKGS